MEVLGGGLGTRMIVWVVKLWCWCERVIRQAEYRDLRRSTLSRVKESNCYF